MPKSTRWRKTARQAGGTHRLRGPGPRPAPAPPPDLSRTARVRLDMLDWHHTHGENVARTARHFGFSRPTVYRWLARFDRFRLESLEDRSSRPARRRHPTWTLAELVAVRRLRLAFPRWGKDKLAVLLRRDEGIRLSVSMVGRILARLRATGELREPTRRQVSVRQRRWSRPHAMRKPADWPIARPGDLVELDTLDIRPLPAKIWKQFTARDRASRWDVVELRRNATARTAAGVLDALALRMPFPVRAISVDNGSEFMAEFEAACAERGIVLLTLPPRSPKLHGTVERANRTHTEEFYEITTAEPELEAFQVELRAWEDTYNRVRPHQALGYLTPAEHLASLGIEV